MVLSVLAFLLFFYFWFNFIGTEYIFTEARCSKDNRSGRAQKIFGQGNQSNAFTPVTTSAWRQQKKKMPKNNFQPIRKVWKPIFPKPGFLEQVMVSKCYKIPFFCCQGSTDRQGRRPTEPKWSEIFKTLMVLIRSEILKIIIYKDAI